MGGGYRHFRDSIQPNGLVTEVNNPDATLNFYSLFAEMEAEVAQDLRLILGTRFDYNEYTDWEIQPTARLLWNVSPQHTLWTSASQAKRIPSRGERVVTMEGPIGFAPEPPAGAGRIPTPLSTRLLSSNTFGTETLTAFEMGYRGQPNTALFVDATAYLHRYKDLRTLFPRDVTAARPCAPDPPENLAACVLDLQFTNEADLSVLGLELSADWRPTRDLRLQATVAFADVQDAYLPYSDRGLETPPLPQISLNAFAPPERMASLRTSWNVNPTTDFDFWVRHVSERTPGVKPMQRDPSSAYLDVRDIPLKSYTTLDARIAWRPAPRTELALIGQNLLDSGRFEFTPLLPRTLPSPVRRGVIGVISHKF
jgi:iron complex outermembrane receptor protein